MIRPPQKVGIKEHSSALLVIVRWMECNEGYMVMIGHLT